MGSLGVEEEQEILKPRTDAREYRKIVLPNGIKVLLISDGDTDKVKQLSESAPSFLSLGAGVWSFFDTLTHLVEV
jgi:hypothetical protein